MFCWFICAAVSVFEHVLKYIMCMATPQRPSNDSDVSKPQAEQNTGHGRAFRGY